MNELKDTSLTGISIVALTAVLPFLENSQLPEAIVAALVGFGLLWAKYRLRG